jgi:hypothetical protein
VNAKSVAKQVLVHLATSEIVVIPVLILAGLGLYALGLPPFEGILIGLMVLSVVGVIVAVARVRKAVQNGKLP